MKRVMIIGQPGSGKSTLARALGERTGLPVYHIDMIHWMSGWQERSLEEKTRLCLEVHAKDAWIFEGGHSTTWPDRLTRCDTLIWLDVPLGKRFRRVIWRTMSDYGKTRPDLPEGCPEQFSFEFMKWIWDTRKSARHGCQKFYELAKAQKTALHLITDQDVSELLSNLPKQSD
ncbi:AAA family ATPase [Cognatishimia activa]|uniref:AAA family ATPase n=1 Tax=Cognatishimia activa TaxID=1715691 RepID=UPI00222F18D6|nr:AAA family ATPase [Cognatishimia activa]UZD91928.1 AAA family ATPase [Cognatishimia activa]